MKQARLILSVLAFCLLLAGRNLSAQYSQQTLSFSLLGDYEYQINDVVVSNRVSTDIIDEHNLNTVLINTANVVKAIAVDEVGTNWTTWVSAALVLRVSMADGNDQAIYLTKGAGSTLTNRNVSKYFNGSFSNNFTVDVPAIVPVLTNNFNLMGSTNYAGWSNPLFDTSATNRTGPLATNGNTYTHSAAVVQFLSFSTANLAFNLLGTSLAFQGNGYYWPASASIRGPGSTTTYQIDVPAQTTTAVGAFFFNTTSNLYGAVNASNQPAYYSGPVRGTFTLTRPIASTNSLTP